MSSGYTPRTEEVRNWATYVPDGTIGMHVSERDAAAFDLWLVEHDRQVRADAWGLIDSVELDERLTELLMVGDPAELLAIAVTAGKLGLTEADLEQMARVGAINREQGTV